MDWKQEAVEKLMLYEARKGSMERIREEMSRLKAEAGEARSARNDGVPVKGGSSTWEDKIISNIMRRQELKKAHYLASSLVKQVEGALDTLTDEERLVLDRLFIRRGKGNVQRLCEELCVEQASVYRRRDSALRRFVIAMYGITES